MNASQTLLALMLLLLPAAPLFAQSPQDEAERLMREIEDRMRDIEQRLARASIEPAEVTRIVEQLREAVQSEDPASMPESLQEFLRSNPEMLARMQNPEATPEELDEAIEEMRDRLESSPEELEQLLSENPDILRRLVEDSESVEEALREYAHSENELQDLFRQAERNMETTEDELDQLIELAQQMQQQMQGSGQGQPQQQGQGQQPQPQGEQGEEGEEGQDGSQPNEGNRSPRDEEADGDRNSALGETWDLPGLPPGEVENFEQGRSSARPEGYEAEANEYYRRMARAIREARERARNNSDAGSGE